MTSSLPVAPVFLSHHPVVADGLALLRATSTPPALFRTAMVRVANVLFFEATSALPLANQSVQTPLATVVASALDESVAVLVVPILRAGLVWTEVALAWLPNAHVFHMGLARDEATLKPITYYNKLAAQIEHNHLDSQQARVLLIDPMLATGGSAIAAIDVLVAHGIEPKHITFMGLIASPEGVEALQQAYPAVSIVCAALDDCLNEQGYIVPGLGDAGDRVFNS
jgi:uracil phosphoribosyltransferase